MSLLKDLMIVYQLTDPQFSSYDPEDHNNSIVAHCDAVIADAEAPPRAKACAQKLKNAIE